ncbi:meckelin-like [Paramacrobiotus metropolitanus]|uniref:meckelin-like n=1 Tax=Paramacrobiotus metropolitanus TaxID=2943436 RepID=UPI002445B269|nr:meckelin-like [Paramacrobiotus metropolitanus]
MELIPVIFMGLFVGGTGLVGLLNSLNWIKRDCRKQFNGRFLINSLATVSGAVAVGIFCTLLLMGFLENIVLLSGFGFDLSVYGERADREFSVWFIVAFSLKAVHMVWLTYLQCVMDIFIVDQEEGRSLHPKINRPTDNAAGFTGCIWRTYFVANELVKLQSARKLPAIVVFTCAYLFLALLPGLPSINTPNGVTDLPSINVSSASTVLPHTGPYYFFTVSALTIMVTAGLVYFVVILRERFFGSPIGELVDVCTWLNCSIFIRTHRYFAYYIHGRSVHPTAEFGFRQLVDMVHNEETNLVSRRGFQADGDPQTFSLALPDMFATLYDQMLEEAQSDSHTAARSDTDAKKEPEVNGAAAVITASTNVPLRIPTESVLRNRKDGAASPSLGKLKQRANIHDRVNRFLRDFLDHKFHEADYVFKWRNILESFLDIELGPVRKVGVMYYDPKGNYTDYFYIGRTFDLLIFEALLFCVVTVYTTNYSLGLVSVLLVGFLLNGIRHIFGKVNLARKAFIYGRFLM